jgi:hypothetical protein
MAIRTIKEILELSPEQRKSLYQASGLPNKTIDIVKIDDEDFKDYSAFSFLMEKSYFKSPTRSSDGSIPDLDTYAWFVTPHLKIDFSMMSIEAYRKIMKMLRSKNEFTVTCYDVVEDKNVTHNMYFATEQMPKLWTIAKALNGGKPWVELIGVNDYTVELIGTNTDFESYRVTYDLNIPSGVTWAGNNRAYVDVPANIANDIGAVIYNGVTDDSGNKNYVNIESITFGEEYSFLKWCETADGNGLSYLPNNAYLFTENKTLYAIWTPYAPK